MRNKNIRLAGLALLLSLCSCEDFKFGDKFLEKPLSTDLTIDTVFSRKVYAEEALNEVYHSLPDYMPSGGRLSWGILENLTDIGDIAKTSGGAKAYYNGDVSSATKGDMPYLLYYDGTTSSVGLYPLEGIRKAYIYLENVDRVPDMSASLKEIRKAEAKMIIAIHYTQMFRFMGGMPWIDHAFRPDDDMLFTRMTVEEMVGKICSLLDEAAYALPWKVTDSEDGRMTAAGALALKARVLLFAASPLFNSDQPFMEGEAADKHYVWYGNYSDSRWQDALDGGLNFLRNNQKNGNFYELVNTGDPRKDFAAGYFNRYNGETLISSHRWVVYGIWNSGAFKELRYGMGTVNAAYADMFRMNTGEEFNWNNPEHRAHPFFDAAGNPVRDIRLYETLCVDGDQYQGRKLEIYEGGREQCGAQSSNMHHLTYNGYGMRKFLRDFSSEVEGKFYTCPLLRLPEVYLSIAEAMNELGKATVKDEFGRDAYDYINLVRGRAGLCDISSSDIAPGATLREEILRERAVEFGFEEVRYFDLTRWKRSNLFKTSIERLIITKNSDNSYTYTKDDKTMFSRGWIKKWTDRYFLIPIPLEEINKKYGLVQNPGW